MRIHRILVPCVLMVGCVAPGPSSMSARAHASTPGQAHGKVIKHRPDAPRLKSVRKGRYRVNKPWTVRLNGRTWQVPAGYTTNGITGPSWVKKSLGDGVDHPETWAAVFHDWLFTQKGVSRAQADQTFYDLLIAYGVPPMKASLMHSSVSAYSASKSIR